MSEDIVSSEMVLPFLPVASRGGPWGDEAYCAGWEMGQLDALLSQHPEEVGLLTIQSDNREQADLIAMRHGYVAETAISDVSGWAYVRLRPTDQTTP